MIVFFSAFFLQAGCKEGVPVIAIESPEAAVSPMWVGAASVFMKIMNTGRGDDVLVGARTDIPGTVTEMHDITGWKNGEGGEYPHPGKRERFAQTGKISCYDFQDAEDDERRLKIDPGPDF